MSEKLALFLYEAVIGLTPAGGGAGWSWGVARELTLHDELEGVAMAASGDSFETDHQVNEQHEVTVAQTWLIAKSSPVDFQLARGQEYTLQITWQAQGYWYQRTYFRVTARSAKQQSVGTLQSLTELVLRAQYYQQAGGKGLHAAPVFTPVAPSGEIEQAAFFHEEVFVPGDYFLGQYVWGTAVAGVSAKAICWAPQVTPVVLGLEVAGVLTSFALTLPVGTANTEVTGSVNLAGLTVPAGQTVRWKVVSGPSDGASAPWEGAIVMQIQG